jgi:hypothetical protein
MNQNLMEVVGTVLWWAEGTKSRKDRRWKNAWTYPIEITNTDPRVILAFLALLKEHLGVPPDRLRLQLQIHEGDNQEELEEYWCRITAIPRENFNKTIVRPVGNKVGKSRGTCKVRCSDKEIYGKLQGRLSEILNNLPGCGAVG